MRTKTLFYIIPVFLCLSAASAKAATYYISPSGSDTAVGTSAAPWKTFSFAVPRLNPGDTLILKDGTYSASNSGYPSIDCAANSKNGTAAAPITLKAENERKAFLDGDGFRPFFMWHCSYWTVEGLRIKNKDNPAFSYGGSPMELYESNNLVIKRNLLSNNNRYVNAPCLGAVKVNNSLLEENEVYFCHRNNISIGSGATGNIVRRNYINARNYADLPDCTGAPKTAEHIPGTPRCSSNPNNGDGGFTCYPCANTIFENNLIENSGTGFDMQAVSGAIDNKFLGNVAFDDNEYGLVFVARSDGGNTLNGMPQDTLIKDFVSLNSISVGLYLRANKNTRCVNCTIIGSGTNSGVVADLPTSQPGDGSPTVYFENVLSLNNRSYGFIVVNQSDWKVENSNSFGNGSPNYSPKDAHVINSNEVDPALGTCKVWIPDNSPMKRAGKNGADIGANILYRYQNGVLTNQPLWNTSTGEFPHGAIVAGVNDIAGQSAFDVHKRLNVNTNGCMFPQGYASGAINPTPTPSPSPTTQGCVNPSPIPSGFSTPCPVFSVSPQSGSLSQNFGVSITPPSTSSGQATTVWIYKTMYITEGSTWKSITLPGTVQYTYWLQGNVTYNLQPTTLGLTAGTHYLATWDWTWDATSQCYKGPGATACGGGQYRVQMITMQ